MQDWSTILGTLAFVVAIFFFSTILFQNNGGGGGTTNPSPNPSPTTPSTCIVSGLEVPNGHVPGMQLVLSRTDKVDRFYHIFTPDQYDSTQPSKIVLLFHGYNSNVNDCYLAFEEWFQIANIYNYVLVMPEGIDETWSFYGSANGLGKDQETTRICDTSIYTEPNDCTDFCAPCPNVCGWTQCVDDDIDFVVDLINDLPNHLCVDSTRIYASGVSNGGMLTWTLGQDVRTASLLAGLAPFIGLPHNDFNLDKGTSNTLPVIGIYGLQDGVVPPGNYIDLAVRATFDDYFYITAQQIHTRWAFNHGGDCTPQNNLIQIPEIPPNIYTNLAMEPFDSIMECRTHCSSVPYSVDCRVVMGHQVPIELLFPTALQFFEEHYLSSQEGVTADMLDSLPFITMPKPAPPTPDLLDAPTMITDAEFPPVPK